MNTVTTVQGDTWDTVSVKAYGKATMAEYLMAARENAPLLDTQVFPSGVTIVAPEAPEETSADLPDWRK